MTKTVVKSKVSPNRDLLIQETLSLLSYRSTVQKSPHPMLIGCLTRLSTSFTIKRNLYSYKTEKVGTVELEVKSKAGHRERLKAHFMAEDDGAYADEVLLELLLTYAIPQKDVQPLAKKLLATFGSLSAVLSADIATLCKQEGIKEHSAVLLKLTDWIRKREVQTTVERAQIATAC